MTYPSPVSADVLCGRPLGVKFPDDETNEQRILRAPAIITQSDHLAVYDAKCGRPQRGEGADQMRTGGGRGVFLWTSFMDDPFRTGVGRESRGGKKIIFVK